MAKASTDTKVIAQQTTKHNDRDMNFARSKHVYLSRNIERISGGYNNPHIDQKIRFE